MLETISNFIDSSSGLLTLIGLVGGGSGALLVKNIKLLRSFIFLADTIKQKNSEIIEEAKANPNSKPAAEFLEKKLQKLDKLV